MVSPTTEQGASNRYARFASDDAATSARRPLLTVTFTGSPVPTVSTVGAISATNGVAAPLNGSAANATTVGWTQTERTRQLQLREPGPSRHLGDLRSARRLRAAPQRRQHGGRILRRSHRHGDPELRHFQRLAGNEMAGRERSSPSSARTPTPMATVFRISSNSRSSCRLDSRAGFPPAWKFPVSALEYTYTRARHALRRDVPDRME